MFWLELTLEFEMSRNFSFVLINHKSSTNIKP